MGLSEETKKAYIKTFMGKLKKIWYYKTPKGSGFIVPKKEDKDEITNT